jgi:hypothetical protein
VILMATASFCWESGTSTAHSGVKNSVVTVVLLRASTGSIKEARSAVPIVQILEKSFNHTCSRRILLGLVPQPVR